MEYSEANNLKIFRCIAGSNAYGTNTEESDIDYRGIFITPPIYLLGFDNVEQVEDGKEDDTLFEIRKYVKLASECNPNILELLFVDERHIIYRDKFYDKLRNNRNLFLSKRVKHTFTGYARAQAHKIELHRRYLLNPSDHKPAREEFGLEESTLISAENRNALISLPEEFVREEIKDYVRREKQYHEKLQEWDSYQEWKEKRNPKRAALEARSGYDTKHAMHLVRLINMGEEILTTGTLTVFRPEREELKAVRDGAWKYDQLKEYVDSIDSRMESIEKESKLPYGCDKGKIKELLVEILSEAYRIDFNEINKKFKLNAF